MPVISRKSEQFIIESEVTSEDAYRRIYHWATWPGGRSGVTVGVGYDLGMAKAADIRRDWAKHVSPQMLEVMVSCAGVSGAAAQRLLPSVKKKIDIDWDAAIAVFEAVDMPKWTKIVLNALPNAKLLPPDCLGVLVSLTYNRGSSYAKQRTADDKQDRYREMRGIKAAVAAKQFEKIPDLLRSMVRLWPGQNERGLPIRRRAEAKLFEDGLKVAPPTDLSSQARAKQPPEIDPDQDENLIDVSATPSPSEPSVTHEVPQSATLIRAVKTDLDSFGYHEFGALNGEWGGRTVAAISAFKLDAGLSGPATIDQELLDAIEEWRDKGLRRPIADDRALAKPADLAPKNEAIQANGQNKIVAFVMGIVGTIGAFFKGVLERFTDATSYLQPVKEFLGDLPLEVWFVGLVGTAAAIYFFSDRSDKATTKDYNDGKLLQ